MMTDYPKANARLAAVARNWADGEVTHETWRKIRNGIIRELVSGKPDATGSDIPAVTTMPPRKASPASTPLATSPVLPVVEINPANAASPEASHDEVLLLALLLVAVLAGALFWLYVI